MLRFASALILSLGFLATAQASELLDAKVADIFERRCVSCHNEDTREGSLSLATSAGARTGGDSGPAVVPGDVEESLLIDMITGDSPSMPAEGDPLSADEIQTIHDWIAAGAVWPAEHTLVNRKFEGQQWWSLEPVVEPAVPQVDSQWAKTPIDKFIVDKLNQEGLTPSAEADRRTLIRRLTFDLHGLPPTPEEIAAFEQDTSPDAYEKLVDRLLASPRYGERWGRHWLDIVHYGETHGYDKDKPRFNAWPYRDYVIRSFNEDKPYSEFVLEQLAGDVLKPSDPDGVVATGFIAAGPWDFVGHIELREGTTDKLITRSNDRDDMLMTAMSTFVSVTAHCARCHDHKFDPIPQRDYYRLQAVFAGLDRADRAYDADPARQARRHQLLAAKADLEQRQKSLDTYLASLMSPELAALDATIRQQTEALAALANAGEGQSSSTLGYHSHIMPEQDLTKWVQVDLGKTMAIDEVVLWPAHVVYGGHPGPGFGFPHRFQVDVSDDPNFATSTVVADHTQADVPNPGDEAFRIDVENQQARYVRVTATKLWNRTNDWIFALSELEVRSQGANVALTAGVTALDSIEAPPSWSTRNFVDGFTSQRSIPAANSDRQLQELEARLAADRVKREKLLASLVDDAHREELAKVSTHLADVTAELAQLPPPQQVYAAVPISQMNPGAGPREIHLLNRGDVKQPGDLMSAGALSTLEQLNHHFELANPNDEGSRRAALARWIVDHENPLTRRSIVNRVWQYHFGRGIVDSPNDFGRMGSQPTHPKLLDYLASQFLKNGESLKWLHRQMLLSATYRQSSVADEERAAIDADNRYLWRMNRIRLDAECVRDAMLAVSGKLDLTMGGPSAQQFFFVDDHSPVYDYARFDVDSPESYRRSVYRFIVRSAPDPLMDCMDAADPSILTPKRNTTLTALQALALLNNPFIVRQAEHFAERVKNNETAPAAQLDMAFRLAYGRSPSEAEAEVLLPYLEKQGLENLCRLVLNGNEFLFID